MNPQQKAIANVLLDMISAVDVSGGAELPEGWIGSFADQLADLDAATINHDGDAVSVDITPIVTSAALLAGVLVDVIAVGRDADRLAVVHTIREHIADNL